MNHITIEGIQLSISEVLTIETKYGINKYQVTSAYSDSLNRTVYELTEVTP
jgi:hypothetical protein